MLISKRGVQSYLFALGLVSIIIGLFLSFVLTGIYGEDNKFCKQVDYKISKACKRDTSVELLVQNNYNSTLEFKINGNRDILKYRLDAGEERVFYVLTKGVKVLTFLPIIKDGEKSFECNGKVKSINSEVLTKCQR